MPQKSPKSAEKHANQNFKGFQMHSEVQKKIRNSPKTPYLASRLAERRFSGRGENTVRKSGAKGITITSKHHEGCMNALQFRKFTVPQIHPNLSVFA